MKLRFELKKASIEILYRILLIVSQVWTASDKIYFYFDEDSAIIYPLDRHGFDKVFARIHILNTTSKHGGEGQGFFSSYQIKSQKPKSAICIAPVNLSSFLEDLKVLVELGYDAQFKLTQTSDGDEIKKYIDIQGSSGATKDVVRSFVEIESVFDTSVYPEVIENKEVEFLMDTGICQNVLAKFHQRFNILNDEFAKLAFKAAKNEAQANQINSQEIQNEESSKYFYTLQLSSKHMKTALLNRTFQADFKGEENSMNVRGEYKVQLKKEVFMKFFNILKMPGSGLLKVNHKQLMELEYAPEKNPNISVVLETSARSI